MLEKFEIGMSKRIIKITTGFLDKSSIFGVFYVFKLPYRLNRISFY